MSYLLDTNVISELRRKSPERNVTAWFESRPSVSLFLSVLTLGELRKGIERLPDTDTRRRLALRDWLDVDLPNFFTGRILAIDKPVADRWGSMLAVVGRPVPAIDSLLAATAMHHGLALVTRNVRDFADLGVTLINPWNG